MTPLDPTRLPLLSGCLSCRAADTSDKPSLPATLVIGSLVAFLSHWLVPVGSLLLCLLLCLLVGLFVWHIGNTRGARSHGGLIAIALAVPLLVDVVRFGRPAVWWLLGGIGVVLAAHLRRPVEISIRRVLLTSARNAVLAALLGLTCVLVIQLALHYISEHHEVLVRTWTLQVGAARESLEEVVLLGPKKLAVLLLLLIATVTIAPSLNVVRNYRRVALGTSHGLLALIVATSFMFFGHSYSRSAEWVARISVAKEHLGAIDSSYEEVIKAAVVERSLVNLASSQQHILISIGQEIEVYPQRGALRERLAAELITSTSRGELAHHAEADRQLIEESPLSSEHRRSLQVIESARERIARGQSVSRRELAALKIERTLAAASRQEARAAIRQLLKERLCPPLVGELAENMIDATRVRARVPPTSRAAVSSAVSHARAEPPRVFFDHVLSLARTEPELLGEVAILVRRTDLKIAAERQAALDAAEAKPIGSFSGRSYGGGGGKAARSGASWVRSAIRFGIRSAIRFGVRGGGPLLTA